MSATTEKLPPDQVAAFNNLGFRLLAALHEPDALLSPYSIAAALSLVAVGSTPSSAVRSEFEQLLASGANTPIAPVTTTDKSVTLRSASAAVLTSLVLPTYKSTVTAAGAELIQHPQSVEPINSWVSKATDGNIPSLFEQLPSPLVAIIINAVFFQAAWTTSFDPAETRSQKFSGEESVRMMRLKKQRFPYAECATPDGKGVQIAQMPYGDGSLVATFVLPSENSSLDNVISALGEQGQTLWAQWTAKLSTTKLDVMAIPRFKLKYGVKSIRDALKTFGLNSAFEENYQNPPYQLITDDKRAYLSDVLHAATLEVTEEGTVASAVTAAVIMLRSIPRPNPTFIAERPFLVAIQQNSTGGVLFIARVDNPVSP